MATPVVKVSSVVDGWMKNDDGNTMPVWYDGNSLSNILIDENAVLDKESDNEYCEDDEPAVDDCNDDSESEFLLLIRLMKFIHQNL